MLSSAAEFVDRLVSGSLRDVLEKVQPAIEAGAVNILSVEAIRDASGERWTRKREQVEAFVERRFAQLSLAGDMMVVLNDTEFVTVQPSVTRAAALSTSVKVVKETLAFFLGKAAREDLRIHQVKGFANGAFSLEPASAAALDRLFEDDVNADVGRAEVRDEPSPATVAPLAEDLMWRPARRVRLVSPPDLDLDLALSPEPTWNVSARVVASFLLSPAIFLNTAGMAPRPISSAELSPNMAGEAALATLAYAVELITQKQAIVALHTPIALGALTYSASRFRLLNALREVPPAVARLLILEIVDVSEGLPQSRLAEVVSMLNPRCRAVLVRAASETAELRAWRGCGVSGATLDCGHLDPADKDSPERLSRFARRATEARLSSVAYNLRSRSLIMAAWAAGFTHLGGPLVSAEVGVPETVRRLTPVDLFYNSNAAEPGRTI